MHLSYLCVYACNSKPQFLCITTSSAGSAKYDASFLKLHWIQMRVLLLSLNHSSELVLASEFISWKHEWNQTCACYRLLHRHSCIVTILQQVPRTLSRETKVSLSRSNLALYIDRSSMLPQHENSVQSTSSPSVSITSLRSTQAEDYRVFWQPEVSQPQVLAFQSDLQLK